MLRRPLKTLRRATGPIVSSMGAAKAPKGTKKPALTPGIMRNHGQFAPGAWVPHRKKISKTILPSPLVCSGDPWRPLGKLPPRLCEKVGKSRVIAFFQWFVGLEGRKVTSLKRRVRSQLARWEMKRTESFAIDDRFGRLKRVQPDPNQTRILRVPPAPWCSGARDWEGERGKMNGTCRGEQVEQDRMKQKLWKFWHVSSWSLLDHEGENLPVLLDCSWVPRIHNESLANCFTR